ncbi:MAG: carbamoyl-phosphate synthase large subunit [Alphaproteobacteria bacterium]|nr:carbamoyl-phosphate synthase large subunit [Alphaproteobacteria bacterium]
MPRRSDINTILIIGSGPITIGQGCEFDYSGVQACKALTEDGYRVVLVNSNPATIMSDPELAAATYIEPLIPEVITQILAKEKVDAILPTMGGQTALNLAINLWESGVLQKLGVEIIGAHPDVIQRAENRKIFRQNMEEIGLDCPKSYVIETVKEAREVAENLGFPIIIRPSFTLGGSGGGIAYNHEDLIEKVEYGIANSPIRQVLLEESVLGWKEYEMEVVRDSRDNCIIVCSIENLDPMGIHTGDSITVAPALTLSDKEYQVLRNASIAVMRKIGVETGGANVQFAINPYDGRIVIIEMNPRVSRSSALASKATGFPIAKIAAKLAVGYTLEEISNDITKKTCAAFEPSIDYVVTKFPRFDFQKFLGSKKILSTYMQSVGEIISLGRCFAESFQKGIRSLEIGLSGLNSPLSRSVEKEEIREKLKTSDPWRFLWIGEAFRQGFTVQEVHELCLYDPWFLQQIKTLVDFEGSFHKNVESIDFMSLAKAKALGFSDQRIAELTQALPKDIRDLRHKYGIRPNYRRIDTCAAEFEAETSYLYSTYELSFSHPRSNESFPSPNKKAIIIGSGPNRIGQGIEFDYCCVKAAEALRKKGIETIIINCNPETVSTDYSISDHLYCEPLTEEDVLEIIFHEQTTGSLLGVITQLGGQTPLKLLKSLDDNNITILGTSRETVDACENREIFRSFCERFGIIQPHNMIVSTKLELFEALEKTNFPVIVRPSYVIGGSLMQIFHSLEEVKNSSIENKIEEMGPLLVEAYLESAIEVDVDGISDGKNVTILAVMEHVEPAGIHSGDSTCSLFPFTLSEAVVEKIKEISANLAKELDIKGVFNVQLAVDKHEKIFILEVNPRASRTIPFVGKALGLPIIENAVDIMLGLPLKLKEVKTEKEREKSYVKKPIFSFIKIPESQPTLGPEMRSTGETMSIGNSLVEALAKAELSDPFNRIPKDGKIYAIGDDEQYKEHDWQKLEQLGFSLEKISFSKDIKEPCSIIVYLNPSLENEIDSLLNVFAEKPFLCASLEHLDIITNAIFMRKHQTFNLTSLQQLRN